MARVADNIRLGTRAPTIATSRDAARLAGADGSSAELPDGYETLVGEGGRPLSAGEAQRIALARAFLRDAALVILDEPTANLDPASAELVGEAVERLRADRTVLLIVHRPELAARADRVVHLQRRAGSRDRGGGMTGRSPARRPRRSAAAPARPLGRARRARGRLRRRADDGGRVLISRAAEQPPILSLTMTIVAVRFFGLARPIARYLERLASHDVALGRSGRTRARFYERIEPLAPGQLEGYRRGELLGRMVGDVDSLRGSTSRPRPPLVALVVGAACVGRTAAFLPAAAVILAAGLLLVGAVVPALAAALTAPRDAARRPRAPSSRPSSSSCCGRARAGGLRAGGRHARPRPGAERRARPPRTARRALGRRRGGALDPDRRVTVAGVLAVAADASIDRVLVATLALLALASFESVTPLLAAARELSATIAAGRRVFELVDREPAVRDPAEPRTPPPVRRRWLSRGDRPLRARRGAGAERLRPAARARATRRARRAERRRQDDGRQPDPPLPRPRGRSRDDRRLRHPRAAPARRAATFALAGQDAHVFNSTIRANLALARPGATDAELVEALDRARIGEWVASLPDGLDTLVGEEGAQLSGGQRQRLTIARALLSDAPVLVLDEPTAHLDAETAEALVRDMLAAAGDRSVLLITHRPEGLDLVDEVVELSTASRAR